MHFCCDVHGQRSTSICAFTLFTGGLFDRAIGVASALFAAMDDAIGLIDIAVIVGDAFVADTGGCIAGGSVAVGAIEVAGTG